ncbi:MAG TPA: DUF1802 family protein [Terriglobia bacterium]|nr:DUF1802 family protein [Terriglobia bacterium]
MRAAFKEWEVVVDALGRGDQILLLRKGGIHEGRGGFRPEHRRFLLFPTRYHQQRECVVASAQARFDEMTRPISAELVRLEFGAELVEARRLEALSQAKALRGQHIWRDEVVERRFDWGKDRGIHVLAVRVFRLAQALELPLTTAYAGCQSWIMLERDIATHGATPVLEDVTFEKKLADFHAVG